MPRQKYNQYGELERNYPVVCRGCNKQTHITWEEFECHHCHTAHCPDCLTVIDKNNTHTQLSHPNLWSGTRNLTVSCDNCGYLITDADVPTF